jgi:hypothetical protein
MVQSLNGEWLPQSDGCFITLPLMYNWLHLTSWHRKHVCKDNGCWLKERGMKPVECVFDLLHEFFR